MLARNWLSVALPAAALLCSACSLGGAEDIAESTSALLAANGTSLNGTSLNGTSLNGTSLNGTSLNGTTLSGVTLIGGELRALSPLGAPLGGAALAGATMAGTTESGAAVTLRIDAVEPSSDTEVFLYTVSYQSGDQWTRICGEDADGAIPAIALEGTWDGSAGTPTGGDHFDSPGMITFACAGSALAKCVNLGYKPWKRVRECASKRSCQTYSLRALHQACTRMVRADYCGDGTPHTLNNVPINVWDSFDLQQKAEVDGDWKREAEWTANGAACVQELRYDPAGATGQYLADHCPERLEAAFSCFGDQSTFFTDHGYAMALTERSLIRVEFDHDYVSDSTDDGE